jgi:hypothetical protein
MHLPASAPAPAGLTAGYRTTFGPGRLRTQNNQLCARQGLCHQAQSPVQIGGSARGYQELSAPLAIPATAEQAGGQAVCLCVASAGRECALLPHSVR